MAAYRKEKQPKPHINANVIKKETILLYKPGIHSK